MITPSHNVRVSDAVWDAAKERADRDDTTISAVIVAALIAYGTPGPVPLSNGTVITLTARSPRTRARKRATS